MFGKFYLLALAGFMVTTLFKMQIENRKTPMLTPQETVRLYFMRNVFYSSASLIFLTVFSFLLTVPGSEWFVKLFSGGQIPTDTPFGIFLFAFFMGVTSETVAGWIQNLKNPLRVSNSNPEIKEVKQETISDNLKDRNQTP